MTKKSYKTSKKWTHGDNCHPLYRTVAVFHSNCLKIMKPFCILMPGPWRILNLLPILVTDLNLYSHFSNSRGGWNKCGGGPKVPELINKEVGINVVGVIF